MARREKEREKKPHSWIWERLVEGIKRLMHIRNIEICQCALMRQSNNPGSSLHHLLGFARQQMHHDVDQPKEQLMMIGSDMAEGRVQSYRGLDS